MHIIFYDHLIAYDNFSFIFKLLNFLMFEKTHSSPETLLLCYLPHHKNFLPVDLFISALALTIQGYAYL